MIFLTKADGTVGSTRKAGYSLGPMPTPSDH